MHEELVASTMILSVRDDTPVEVQRMLAYMAQRCDVATLSMVARHFGVSPASASHRLRHYAGASFSELLAEMRMRRAADLLAFGLPVAQIASLCGYADVARFQTAFRRRYGVSPGHWASGGATCGFGVEKAG